MTHSTKKEMNRFTCDKVCLVELTELLEKLNLKETEIMTDEAGGSIEEGVVLNQPQFGFSHRPSSQQSSH